jgi:hypothetical protein
MSSCRFTINFSLPVQEIIDKARSAIVGQGGVFNGDVSSGNFSVQFLGSIAGEYTISGHEMNINITSKPMFISCSQIESFMRNQLGGN